MEHTVHLIEAELAKYPHLVSRFKELLTYTIKGVADPATTKKSIANLRKKLSHEEKICFDMVRHIFIFSKDYFKSIKFLPGDEKYLATIPVLPKK